MALCKIRIPRRRRSQPSIRRRPNPASRLRWLVSLGEFLVVHVLHRHCCRLPLHRRRRHLRLSLHLHIIRQCHLLGRHKGSWTIHQYVTWCRSCYEAKTVYTLESLIGAHIIRRDKARSMEEQACLLDWFLSCCGKCLSTCSFSQRCSFS